MFCLSGAKRSKGLKTGFVSLPNIEKYKSEAARLATFDAWTYPHPAPKDLAKSGLCYLGQGDAVQCAYCKKIICLQKAHCTASL